MKKVRCARCGDIFATAELNELRNAPEPLRKTQAPAAPPPAQAAGRAGRASEGEGATAMKWAKRITSKKVTFSALIAGIRFSKCPSKNRREPPF